MISRSRRASTCRSSDSSRSLALDGFLYTVFGSEGWVPFPGELWRGKRRLLFLLGALDGARVWRRFRYLNPSTFPQSATSISTFVRRWQVVIADLHV
jgi:hypothetical protein